MNRQLRCRNQFFDCGARGVTLGMKQKSKKKTKDITNALKKNETHANREGNAFQDA